MGLLDFFRRKPTVHPGADRSARWPGVTTNEPRVEHDLFAHVALRQASFANPTAAVATLGGPDSRKMIEALLGEVQAHCRSKAYPTAMHPSDVRIATRRVGRFPAVVLTMPTPVGPTEAFFVAMVLHLDLEAGAAPDESAPPPKLSYLTLEATGRAGMPPRTMLCGWEMGEPPGEVRDRHSNYGEGPQPTYAAFVASVEQKVLAHA